MEAGVHGYNRSGVSLLGMGDIMRGNGFPDQPRPDVPSLFFLVAGIDIFIQEQAMGFALAEFYFTGCFGLRVPVSSFGLSLSRNSERPVIPTSEEILCADSRGC